MVKPPVAGTILWPAAFAPDGKSLAVIAPNAAGFDRLALLKLPGGAPTFFGPADCGRLRAALDETRDLLPPQ